ncbi:hypothetical protein Hanom_Chr16g01453471 [Helianthus anomalus]
MVILEVVKYAATICKSVNVCCYVAPLLQEEKGQKTEKNTAMRLDKRQQFRSIYL